MRIKLAVLLAAAVLAIAGCASSPPSARSVAARIPGCHPRAVRPAPLDAPGEVTCDFGPVSFGFPENSAWLAPFASQSAAKAWLRSIGTGNGALPAGGCIEGTGWAADITTGSPPPQDRVFMRAARELGGTLVATGFCA